MKKLLAFLLCFALAMAVGVAEARRFGNVTVLGTLDARDAETQIASGTSLPATCTTGEMFIDTDADTDGSLYFCRDTDTWKEVDDDGAAGGGDLLADGSVPMTADWTFGAYDLNIGEGGGIGIGGTGVADTLLIETSDTDDPTIILKTTNSANQVNLILDESAVNDRFCIHGQTALVDTHFHLHSQDGETARFVIYSGASDYFEIVHGEGNNISLRNAVSDKDILFYCLDGAADTLMMTLDGSVPEVNIPVNLTSAGTIEGATLTEGGVAVINATEGGTWFGDHNFGSSTTNFEIPSDAAITDPNVAGEIAIDLTTDQLLYYGGAQRVLTYFWERGFTLETPVAADDNIPFWHPKHAVTITDVYCECEEGTSVGITISDGTNNLEEIICDADGQADDGSIANGTFSANERMEFSVGTVTGSVDWVTVSISGTIDAD